MAPASPVFAGEPAPTGYCSVSAGYVMTRLGQQLEIVMESLAI